MKPFLWLFAVLALEGLVYSFAFALWGWSGTLLLAALDFALLALVQHHRFTSIPS